MSEASGVEAEGGRQAIRVFLLDDHEVVRRADVGLLDVRLPDGDGVRVCRDIRSALPGTACLMLTAYGDDRALLGAIMAGAARHVDQEEAGRGLVGGRRAVAGGPSAYRAE